MKLTYDTQTGHGEINGFFISEKPKFTFEYEWFLVNDKVAYKLLSYGGLCENEPLSEDEKAEVLEWAKNYKFPTPPKPKPLSLDELKLQKIKELNLHVNARLESFLSNYPSVEQKSFPDKKEEALRVKKDNTLPLEETPVLTALIPVKSIEARNYLSEKVLEKVAMLTKLEQFAVLTRDKIKEAKSKKALNEINWEVSNEA